jgi:ComF family protein
MSAVLDLIFPRRCYGCNRIGFYFCPDCLNKIKSQPVKHSPGQRIEGTVNLFRYCGAIKSAIIDLKYNFVSDLASEFGHLISQTLAGDFPNLYKYWRAEKFSLLPVPLHWQRFNWRGFNQSQLLCQEVSDELSLPLLDDFVTRTVNTPPQALKAKRQDRLRILDHTFSCHPRPLASQNFIIFDDVFTTGSTLNALISALPKKSQCWILTVAG